MTLVQYGLATFTNILLYEPVHFIKHSYCLPCPLLHLN